MKLTVLYSLCGALLLTSATLVAQQPPAGAPGQGAPGGARAGGAAAPAPTNLKVLPKTWSRAQVQQLMQTFNESLGVACAHCHAEDPTAPEAPAGQTRRLDYALDTKKEKDISREMIKAVMATNEGTKALGDAAVLEKTSCWTCHRGQKQPEKAPAAGWGRGNFTLSEAGPTVPQRGGGARGGARGGAPGGGAAPVGRGQ
jgi:hypothetical protein